MTTTNILRIVLASCVTPWLAAAESQPLVDVGVTVSLEPEIQCWAQGEHSTAFASVDPGAPITRLYFRCSLYPDYYFVNLEPQGDLYSAVLPQATGECPSVYCYVEAVSADFASSRTRERILEVATELIGSRFRGLGLALGRGWGGLSIHCGRWAVANGRARARARQENGGQ